MPHSPFLISVDHLPGLWSVAGTIAAGSPLLGAHGLSHHRGAISIYEATRTTSKRVSSAIPAPRTLNGAIAADRVGRARQVICLWLYVNHISRSARFSWFKETIRRALLLI